MVLFFYEFDDLFVVVCEGDEFEVFCLVEVVFFEGMFFHPVEEAGPVFFVDTDEGNLVYHACLDEGEVFKEFVEGSVGSGVEDECF